MDANQRNRELMRRILDAQDQLRAEVGEWDPGWSAFEPLLRALLPTAARSEAELARLLDRLIELGLESPAAPLFRTILRQVHSWTILEKKFGAPAAARPAPDTDLGDAIDFHERDSVAGSPARGPMRDGPQTLPDLEHRGGAFTPRMRQPPATPSPAAPPPPEPPAADAEPPNAQEAAETPPEPEPSRFVNFRFDQTFPVPRTLGLREGFRPGRTYRLMVSIEDERDARYGGSGDQPAAERPENTPDPIDLHVAIFTRGKAVTIEGSPLDRLTWPARGPSTRNATFLLHAAEGLDRRTGGVDVMIYFRANLLYAARLKIDVLPDEEVWAEEERPITWTHMADEDERRSPLFQHFARVSRLSERALSLAIRRGDAADEYLLTAFMGRAELPARVTMRREQLVGYVSEVRGRLDELRRERVYIEGGFDAAGVYVGDYAGNEGGFDAAGKPIPLARRRETFNAFLRDMAVLGSKLWDELFGDPSGQLLRNAIQAHLQEGDVIQIWIDHDATEFVYPWNWLYGDTLDPGRRFTVNRDSFWGYRYVIEQLPQYPETAGLLFAEPFVADPALRVKVGTFQFEGTTAAQQRYFADRAARSGGTIESEFWESDEPWERFLPACDSQILYFFSHGHTARPAAEATAHVYDMLAKMQAWVAEPATPDESEYLRAYRERGAKFLAELDGPLLAETYIKLTYGNLLLRELRNLMDLKDSAPLVFLNMCESAQVFPHIAEGLIDVFLRKGARAVIGTEMPMLPHFADLFSRRFFDAFLLAPRTDVQADGEAPAPTAPLDIGIVLYRLRREFLDRGNPLGFAYTLFGSASTRLAAPLPQADSPEEETTS